MLGDLARVRDFLAGGGSPNVTDGYDCEPIYTAVKYDRIEIARTLLDAGGDITRTSRLRGDPLGVACWNWNVRMIDFCVAAGVDINADRGGESILDLLERQRALISEDALPAWKKAHDRLVEHGAQHSRDLARPDD